MSGITNWLVENQVQISLWVFTWIALVGSYYNATMRCKLSYILWFVSNFFFLGHNFRIGEIQQGVLYTVLLITSVVGIKNTIHQKGWFSRSQVN
ncbi:MAG: hypothetical protein LBS71_01390 [Puniceicoccales bacterium]|jgi:hypothetical protein|nr:hypothetical protein [Puniceicoccales bacterium]